MAEIGRQNQELLLQLEELRRARRTCSGLNQELEDTNRGVVALYAELDERADHLRRADELKSRFLSNMSHEFRTPLNSILALSRLLLARSDGPLTAEQETQVRFIRKAAEDLTELVNDLLDLAKVEAGKIVVVPSPFTVASLFGALRGMLRPLLVGDAVALVFEDPQRRAAARHRRRQGLADPAQLHLQRAQVHRAGRGARLGDGRSPRPTRSASPCATPASASRQATSSSSSRSSARSHTRCRVA